MNACMHACIVNFRLAGLSARQFRVAEVSVRRPLSVRLLLVRRKFGSLELGSPEVWFAGSWFRWKSGSPEACFARSLFRQNWACLKSGSPQLVSPEADFAGSLFGLNLFRRKLVSLEAGLAGSWFRWKSASLGWPRGRLPSSPVVRFVASLL